MKMIMKISDVFESKRHGVLVSGSNQLLDDVAREEIDRLIGKKIRVVADGRKMRDFEVFGVDLSKSIVGKLNITISVGNDLAPDILVAGAEVFALS
jgi:hypothetical protein